MGLERTRNSKPTVNRVRETGGRGRHDGDGPGMRARRCGRQGCAVSRARPCTPRREGGWAKAEAATTRRRCADGDNQKEEAGGGRWQNTGDRASDEGEWAGFKLAHTQHAAAFIAKKKRSAALQSTMNGGVVRVHTGASGEAGGRTERSRRVETHAWTNSVHLHVRLRRRAGGSGISSTAPVGRVMRSTSMPEGCGRVKDEGDCGGRRSSTPGVGCPLLHKAGASGSMPAATVLASLASDSASSPAAGTAAALLCTCACSAALFSLPPIRLPEPPRAAGAAVLWVEGSAEAAAAPSTARDGAISSGAAVMAECGGVAVAAALGSRATGLPSRCR